MGIILSECGGDRGGGKIGGVCGDVGNDGDDDGDEGLAYTEVVKDLTSLRNRMKVRA